MSAHSELIAKLGTLSVGMAETQLKDVTPKIFARFPASASLAAGHIQTNHAAFVYGHLALYPSMLLGYFGLDPSKAPKPAGFDDLFAAGKECVDDPNGTIYPAMSVITEAFFTNHKVLLEMLPSVSDAVLAQPHPREQARGRFPTLAHAATFMVTGHMMFHLGQVSAWRRAHGLASAQG